MDRQSEAYRSSNKRKMTPEDVKDLRRRYREEDVTQAELAREYGISRQHANEIINLRAWRDVGTNFTKWGEIRERKGARGSEKLTISEVRQIREKYAAGDVYQKELAHEYGVSRAQINRIINRKAWEHV